MGWNEGKNSKPQIPNNIQILNQPVGGLDKLWDLEF